jgi:hypothetical protein
LAASRARIETKHVDGCRAQLAWTDGIEAVTHNHDR